MKQLSRAEYIKAVALAIGKVKDYEPGSTYDLGSVFSEAISILMEEELYDEVKELHKIFRKELKKSSSCKCKIASKLQKYFEERIDYLYAGY